MSTKLIKLLFHFPLSCTLNPIWRGFRAPPQLDVPKWNIKLRNSLYLQTELSSFDPLTFDQGPKFIGQAFQVEVRSSTNHLPPKGADMICLPSLCFWIF
jgi:hypothetical protein